MPTRAHRAMLSAAVAPLRTCQPWASCALPILPPRRLPTAASHRLTSHLSRTETTSTAVAPAPSYRAAGRRIGPLNRVRNSYGTHGISPTFAIPARYMQSSAVSASVAASAIASSGPRHSRVALPPNFFFSSSSSSRHLSLSNVHGSSMGGYPAPSKPPPPDIPSLLASYAPTSDDPTKVDEGEQDATQHPPKTASQALASGYRPVPALDTRTLPRVYRALSKSQLTFLIVLTSMAPYALVPASLSAAAAASGASAGAGVATLLSLTAGTALCSASANAVNELVEWPYDAQMPRTRNRPLPSRALSPLHAATFAAVCGTSGTALLALAVNPLTAALGATNLALYAFAYTPSKRLHIANTWLGAIVGAIPPLMGWAACTGSLSQPSDAAAWVLAAVLFAWQFPHFNSLAHSLRSEYARGGYRMMSVSHPALNRRTSLRYALALVPLCSVALPATGVVVPAYALLSLPANVGLAWWAWRFYARGGEAEARRLFFASLVHLPVVLLLAMACKSGFWEKRDEVEAAVPTREVPEERGAE